MTDPVDEGHMRAALALARRALGAARPNPVVGCILVRDDRVVGRGATGEGGRPHAEAAALQQAGDAARGATAYVTLEPCNHHGKTPPCAAAMIRAGVARVVIAAPDPDPRVCGKGASALRAAGVDVVAGVCRPAALWLNAGHFLRIAADRPMVTLKTATTLDGRIAAASGASRWITGPQARRMAHLLRARHDAVLVGVATALADNPQLTCRLPGLRRREPPVRVVLDGALRLPLDGALARTARDAPLWLFHRQEAPPDRRRALLAAGARLFELQGEDRADGLRQALRHMAAAGLTRLLVEGGGQVAASFLRAGYTDEIAWFRAAAVMGGDGLPAIAAPGATDPQQMPRFLPDGALALGPDRLERYLNPATQTLLEELADGQPI